MRRTFDLWRIVLRDHEAPAMIAECRLPSRASLDLASQIVRAHFASALQASGESFITLDQLKFRVWRAIHHLRPTQVWGLESNSSPSTNSSLGSGERCTTSNHACFGSGESFIVFNQRSPSAELVVREHRPAHFQCSKSSGRTSPRQSSDLKSRCASSADQLRARHMRTIKPEVRA